MFSNMSFKFGCLAGTSSSSAKIKSFYSALVEEKGGNLLIDSSNTSAEKTNYYVVIDDDIENVNHNNNIDDILNDDSNHTNNHTNNSNTDTNNTIIVSYHWIAACITANCLVPVHKYVVAQSSLPQFIYEMKPVSKGSLGQNDNNDMVKPLSLSMPNDLIGSTNQPPENSSLYVYLQILAQKQPNTLSGSANDLIEGIAGIRGCVFSLSGFSKRRTNNDHSLVPDKRELELGIRLAGGRVGDGCMVQGITSYLICLKRYGEKFDAATRWGSDKIKIVTWEWLLCCLQQWSYIDPQFEDHLDTATDITELTYEHSTIASVTSNINDNQIEEQVKNINADHSHKTDIIMNAGEPLKVPTKDFTGPIQDLADAPSQFAMDFYDSPPTQPPPSMYSARTPIATHTGTKSEPGNSAKSGSVHNTSVVSRCFVLGGGSDLEACEQRAKNVLEGLGANVVWPLETRFDPAGTTSGSNKVTHVILWGPLKRTEKYLCAVASGLWLLHPDYIDACELAGCFLPEDPFEWQARDNTNALACAASYRRRGRDDGEASVFYDQRYVIVGPTSPPADTLLRIIERGGGVAVVINTIADLNSAQCTGTSVSDDAVVQRKITAIIKTGVISSATSSSAPSSSSASASSVHSLIPMLPPSFVLDMICTVDSDLCTMINRCCVDYWNCAIATPDESAAGENVDTSGSKRTLTSKTKQKGKRCKS